MRRPSHLTTSECQLSAQRDVRRESVSQISSNASGSMLLSVAQATAKARRPKLSRLALPRPAVAKDPTDQSGLRSFVPNFSVLQIDPLRSAPGSSSCSRRDQATLGHVVQCSHDEQRVPSDCWTADWLNIRQTVLRTASLDIRRLRLRQRLQSDLAHITDVPAGLLENIEGVVRHDHF